MSFLHNKQDTNPLNLLSIAAKFIILGQLKSCVQEIISYAVTVLQ